MGRPVRVPIATPAMLAAFDHKAETARQMACRARYLLLQARHRGPAEDRLPIERRMLRRRALRLQRMIRAMAEEIESQTRNHLTAQFKKRLPAMESQPWTLDALMPPR